MDLTKKQIKTKVAVVFTFAVEDFRNKYAGSLAGALWAFVNPLMTIVIYWFIFQVGFKSAPVQDYPFVLWLISGLLPWFLISDALPGATSCLGQYSFLVKKIAFDVKLLPMIKIASSMIVHVFLILITLVIFALCGHAPDLFTLQLIPYILYTCLLLIGVGYIGAALYAFFKDILQIVSLALQVLFWLTPIVWNHEIMPDSIQNILILNPVYYAVAGYRNALIYKEGFFRTGPMLYYYWGLAVALALLGWFIYRRMEEHFADVL